MEQPAKKILFFGHSHLYALQRAGANGAPEFPGIEFAFLNLDDPALLPAGAAAPDRTSGPRVPRDADLPRLKRPLREAAADAALIVVCTNGNEHNILSFLMPESERRAVSPEAFAQQIEARVAAWLHLVVSLCPARVLMLPPPPPLESEERILATKKVAVLPPIEPLEARLALWRLQCATIARTAAAHGLGQVRLPPSVFSASGCLAENCCGDDPTHGNGRYGRAILRAVVDHFERLQAGHPYADRPDNAFWDRAVGNVARGDVDPVGAVPFQLAREDRVATAGSCFAQHISRRLRGAGFNYYVAEEVPGDERPYEFSARYGNIYTSRQLLQLFDRAFGYFRPLERCWTRPDRRFADPFRPRIRDDGFESEAAVADDVRAHLLAVRKMFRSLDVLVFTLGLTECWSSRIDGSVYPLAPGVAAGTYDPAKYRLLNLSVDEVRTDLEQLLRKLALVNPGARVLLTVSPVPLVATAEDRHVLAATTYSKSVLRVAAEQVARGHDNVAYFPSYEIITGSHANGAYFAADRRSVTEEGVDHVMRVFMARMTQGGAPFAAGVGSASFARAEALADALCDEEALRRE
jgi:hypothetical protein